MLRLRGTGEMYVVFHFDVRDAGKGEVLWGEWETGGASFPVFLSREVARGFGVCP